MPRSESDTPVVAVNTGQPETQEWAGADGAHMRYVETIVAPLVRPPDVFPLESGDYLPELVVAYETYGSLNAAASNAIMICHGFTASAHAAGRHHALSFAPGWWDPLIGPGRAFDTDRYFVVCSNMLGSCLGTTGPSSLDPRAGRAYASRFPAITIGDMIAAQRRLMRHLGIAKLVTVAGASMGGMAALEWGLRFPETTLSAIPIGCAARWSAQAVALSAAARRAIEADADFQGGEYYGLAHPLRGLAVARMIGHITYVSPDVLERQRGVSTDGPSTDILHYFQVECDRFVERFDANSYISLSLAMERYDASALLEATPENRGRAALDWLLLSFSSDWLFPPFQLSEVDDALVRLGHRSQHRIVPTEKGHDAFLVEPLEYAHHIAVFLESVTGRD